MANPVQPNRPWELIQQNRRKLRQVADPAQILAQTPEVIVAGTTDRDAPVVPEAVPTTEHFLQVITDATVGTYTLPLTPTRVLSLQLNGLTQRFDGWSNDGAVIDVVSLKKVAGDTLQVDYEV